ncbi:hypothetical protein [Rhizobacter sp. Root1221]|uniref:hypothetical protein n=1 Tax=Rhizobacter sp. Root1221 TaxID=1736433 RepID=UPI0007015A3F|nr:hypothetical protein [Rhizobacter sp. Root1221]KQV85451.1 hypothetical protein ASC87_07105 [Rhizobacter sp. Root1221]
MQPDDVAKPVPFRGLAINTVVWAASLWGAIEWKVNGIDGAGNVLLAWLWFFGVFGLLSARVDPKDRFSKARAWARLPARAAALAVAAVLVWFGAFGCVALIAAGFVGTAIHRSRPEKP